jgi:hypothetical protein
MAKVIYFDATDKIFEEFNNYEIHPCLIVEKLNSGEIIYETCDFDHLDIAIWCVYGHFWHGGLECISDHDSLEEADKFEKTLPILN